jgi:hypothetical protein
VEPSYAGITGTRVVGSSKKHLGGALVCSFSHFFLHIDRSYRRGRKAAGSSVCFPLSSPGCTSSANHLRRGPLVSPGPIQSMDDRATIRSLFYSTSLLGCVTDGRPFGVLGRSLRPPILYLHWKCPQRRLHYGRM